MKSLNLFSLTRADVYSVDFSRFLQELSGGHPDKSISVHEAASLYGLVECLEGWFRAQDPTPADDRISSSNSSGSWVSCLDGFWISYTIAHISKEFDLLKFSSDAHYVLNIELKSDSVSEERIQKQLEQNRYYLSNVSGTIYSFTYVLETDTIYQLTEKKYLRIVDTDVLASVLRKSCFQNWISEGLDKYFRSSDYLISPVGAPERLLQGKYFLTNQQWEFRRRILRLVQGEASPGRAAEGHAAEDLAVGGHAAEGLEVGGHAAEDLSVEGHATDDPAVGDHAAGDISNGTGQRAVIVLTGSAGTGKTLLLFDLAMALSRKKRVLFLHGGPLREGHRVIDARLRNVDVRSGTELEMFEQIEEGYAFVLIDEANRLQSASLGRLLTCAAAQHIAVILAYDPYSVRAVFSPMEDAEGVINTFRTDLFEFSGNIRINRPIYSFMRNVFNLKDRTEHVDYSCIDVLYAGNRDEEQILADYYAAKGYVRIQLSAVPHSSEELVSQEYSRVLITMGSDFVYDEALHLRRKGDSEDETQALSTLYEALTRTREQLAVLITENPDVFSRILQIRMSG